MVRPHPAVWRFIHGVLVAYLLLMVFLLFQDVGNARQFLKVRPPGLCSIPESENNFIHGVLVAYMLLLVLLFQDVGNARQFLRVPERRNVLQFFSQGCACPGRALCVDQAEEAELRKRVVVTLLNASDVTSHSLLLQHLFPQLGVDLDERRLHRKRAYWTLVCTC